MARKKRAEAVRAERARSALTAYKPSIWRLARRLAVHYFALCKARNIHMKPWCGDYPEIGSVIAEHFAKAALLVTEMGCDPKDFMEAQFEELYPPGSIPSPYFLHSELARLRAFQWLAKQSYCDPAFEVLDGRNPEHREALIMQGIETLERLSAERGVSQKQILKEFRHCFSPHFLRLRSELKRTQRRKHDGKT